MIARLVLHLYHRLFELPEESLQAIQARYRLKHSPVEWSQCGKCGVLVRGAHNC